jgi:hypothetical protein
MSRPRGFGHPLGGLFRSGGAPRDMVLHRIGRETPSGSADRLCELKVKARRSMHLLNIDSAPGSDDGR